MPLIAVAVLAFGIAFGYVEAAVVVDLRAAIGEPAQPVFPLSFVTDPGLARLVFIEAGREAATIAMLAALGIAVGRSRLERLAWTAVAFGAWDIAYYGWLAAFSGWPTSLADWDLLFLLPVPWVGPVWAPVAVSGALIGFGLAAAARLRAGGTVRLDRRQAAAGFIGGGLVILGFTIHGPAVAAGLEPPGWSPQLFLGGMAIALVGAWAALRDGQRSGSLARASAAR